MRKRGPGGGGGEVVGWCKEDERREGAGGVNRESGRQ